jgi:hypothetical protein
MKLENLKDLEKAIKLCRKLGVETLRIDTVEIKLGDEPKTELGQQLVKGLQEANTYAPGIITEDSKIETTELTEEQLLFYSSASHDS